MIFSLPVDETQITKLGRAGGGVGAAPPAERFDSILREAVASPLYLNRPATRSHYYQGSVAAMTVSDSLVIVAILLAPIVAVQVQRFFDTTREKTRVKPILS